MFGIANIRAGPAVGRGGGGLARAAVAAGLDAYLSVYHRLTVEGRDRLPAGGPFVLVSNHASHLDAICLRAVLPPHRLGAAVTAVAQEYFYTAGPVRRWSARWMANAVPFARQLHVRGGMRRCRTLLADDEAVLVFFPEGTRSPDGRLGVFRPGIGALVAGSSIPVVPCAIHGAHAAWPKGRRLARPGRVTVTVGHPRWYDRLPRTRRSYHAVADDLRAAVEGLLCA